jgi:hypothetical protein
MLLSCFEINLVPTVEGKLTPQGTKAKQDEWLGFWEI